MAKENRIATEGSEQKGNDGILFPVLHERVATVMKPGAAAQNITHLWANLLLLLFCSAIAVAAAQHETYHLLTIDPLGFRDFILLFCG